MRQMNKVIVLLGLLAASCRAPVNSSSKLQDQFSGASFYYLDSSDRQQVLTDLRDMVVDNYVLLSIKSALGIVVAPGQLFNDAISREVTRGDVGNDQKFSQASSNLAFLDDVQKTIAMFQDTHFSSRALVARSTVLNGLQVDRIGADVLVTGKRSKVLAFDQTLARDPLAYDGIVNGIKVLSIDGIPVEDLVSKLVPFISSSTRSYADIRAVQALSGRSFQLPEKAFADWEFQPPTGPAFTVRLPYYYLANASPPATPTTPLPVVIAPRKDEKFFFETVGIAPLNELTLDYNDEQGVWANSRALGVVGFNPRAAPKGLVGAKVWYDAPAYVVPPATVAISGREIHRTGYMMKDGKAYGVLQIFGFGSHKVTSSTVGSPVTDPVDFIAPVQQFVKELKAAGMPLILDLRFNGGGDPMLSIAVLSALAKTGETYPSTIRGLRVTRIMRQMIDEGNLESLPDFNHYDYDQTTIDQLKIAVSNHTEYTSAFTLTDDVAQDPVVGGYDQKIITMVTPACISACDGMSMLLQRAHRGDIMGTTTNGTGAGFIGSGAFTDIQWHDRFEVLALRIPNRLFGYGGAVGQHVFSNPTDYMTMNGENHPVVANIQYVDAVADRLDGASGWYAEAISHLQ